MISRRFVSLALFLQTAAFAAFAPLGMQACGAEERPDFDDKKDGGGTDGGGIAPPANDSGAITSGGSSGGGGGGTPEVFVHSSDTLYKLDPKSSALELTQVGKFSGFTGSMVDIALNEDGDMFGTTYDAVYKIDKETAAATLIKESANPGDREYPDSLSFVPKGTLEDDREVLVGYRGSDYIQIDPETGNIKVIKANALGAQLVSSGDIVSIKGDDFLTYLTVKPKNASQCTGECEPCKQNDCLFQVDPVTGAKISNLGSTKRENVFGLAFWEGTVYGINTEGFLFKLDPDDNVKATNITVPGAPIKFFGAGSSTSAPPGPN